MGATARNALLIKRMYEDWAEADGCRVLVDRLWPRGFSKEKARLDVWAKDIAPSSELRKDFHHEEQRFDAFVKAYRQELDTNPAAPDFLSMVRQTLERKPVTLLYSAKNTTLNQAVVLREWLLEQLT